MWLCRISRPVVAFAVTLLAKHITVWSANDDKRVARLIGYLHNKSHEYSPVMCIRDPPELLNLSLYCDADFGGDIRSMRSTSGFVLAVSGPSSFAPVSWGTKRQSVVSRSTTECEFVSLSTAVFSEAIPTLQVWQELIPGMTLKIFEDNAAVVSIIFKGYSNKLRHLSKTHRIHVASTADK